MHVASHDLFNMKLRTCLDTGISSATKGPFAKIILLSPISSSTYTLH